MCGIVGAAGNLVHADKKVFTNMFFLNALRGIHGCGVVHLFQEGKDYYYVTEHSKLPSSDYVFTKGYDDHVKGKTRGLFGHSRHATVGKISVENNHPFEVDGDLVGMHNGTIRGVFEGRSNHATDSEALMNLINREGLKGALDDVHRNCYDVAYALALYEPKLGQVTIIRNEKRPMKMVRIKDKVFWASESSFIEFGLRRADISTKGIEEIEINPFDRVTISYLGNEKNIVKVDKKWYTPAARKFYTYVRSTTNNVGPSWWDKYDKDNDDTEQDDEFEVNSAPIEYVYIGSRFCSLTYLQRLMQEGCAITGEVPQGDDIWKVKFRRDNLKEFFSFEAQTEEHRRDFGLPQWDSMVSPVKAEFNQDKEN